MKRTLQPALTDPQRERFNELADKFRRTRHLMWVCAFQEWQDSFMGWGVAPYDWRFGVNKPAPVPNPQMEWRYPTLEEYLDRQQRYEEDPCKFFKFQLERRTFSERRGIRYMQPALSYLKGR